MTQKNNNIDSGYIDNQWNIGMLFIPIEYYTVEVFVYTFYLDIIICIINHDYM